MQIECILKHFDTPSLRFTSKSDSAIPAYEITGLNEDKRELIPLDFEVSEEGIQIIKETSPNNI